MKKYSYREKANYWAKQSKKGAKSTSGRKLKSFERGKNIGKLEAYNQSVDYYYYKNPKKLTAEKAAKKAQYKAKRKADYEAYKAKQAKKLIK